MLEIDWSYLQIYIIKYRQVLFFSYAIWKILSVLKYIRSSYFIGREIFSAACTGSKQLMLWHFATMSVTKKNNFCVSHWTLDLFCLRFSVPNCWHTFVWARWHLVHFLQLSQNVQRSLSKLNYSNCLLSTRVYSLYRFTHIFSLKSYGCGVFFFYRHNCHKVKFSQWLPPAARR